LRRFWESQSKVIIVFIEIGASENRRIWSSETWRKNQLRGNTKQNKGYDVLSDEKRI